MDVAGGGGSTVEGAKTESTYSLGRRRFDGISFSCQGASDLRFPPCKYAELLALAFERVGRESGEAGGASLSFSSSSSWPSPP